MPNGSSFPLSALSAQLFVLAGSFATNGGSSPVAASNAGAGFTVTRTGAGTYALKLTEHHVGIVSALPGEQCAAAGGFTVSFGAYNSTTRTLTVFTLVAGVATDVAANASNRVHFTLFLRGSRATR